MWKFGKYEKHPPEYFAAHTKKKPHYYSYVFHSIEWDLLSRTFLP
jgi:superoxide dismutase